jgi:hypothetical protein
MKPTAAFNLELDLNDVNELLVFYQRIYEPLFTLRDAGISSKIFQDWQKAGLWYQEYKPAEKRQWTRLNLEQYIWLKLIQQLRQLGATTDLVLKVKEHLLTNFDLPGYLMQPAYKAKALEAIEKQGLPEADRKIIKDLIQSGEMGRQLQEAGIGISNLLALLFSALIRHQRVGVFAFPDGEVVSWVEEILSRDAGAMELFQRSHIYLSIQEHLVAFLLDPGKEKFISPIQLLSNEEKIVLNYMRDKTLKRLEIKVANRGKGTKPELTLITTTDGKVSLKDFERIASRLIGKNYESITAKNFNGTEIYFERSKEKKLS